jgi:hypothetical protein
MAMREPGHPRAERVADGAGVAGAVTTLTSILTCPECGATSEEKMPENACRFFHECAACGTLIRPKPGDCCVFCSYGSVPCPPVQQSGKCCE